MGASLFEQSDEKLECECSTLRICHVPLVYVPFKDEKGRIDG